MLHYSSSTIEDKSPSIASQIRVNKNHRSIVQNFILLWLDLNINESDATFDYAITQLRAVINTINIYSDADECIDVLTELKEEKVFMIMSSAFGQQIIPLIHDISQLYCIYILCDDSCKHEIWMNEWTKLNGVFTQIESICKSLERNTKQCDHDLIPFSIIGPSDYTKPDLNELEPSFMYSQLLKEILLEIEYNEHAIKEAVQLWREQYNENKSALKIINEFEREYHLHSPIWWYTRDCFIYSMLNRALRTMDIDTLVKMSFFLCDVHRQIEQLHTQQSNIPVSLIVYRGQGMLNNEFEKLRNSKGGLLSFNNFLSTSADPEVAKIFCPVPQHDLNMNAVLFEMKIVNPDFTHTPFASLDNVSNFSEGEKEILFSMHSVFRIDQITEIEERVWRVQLTLTSDDDEQLKILTDCMRKETLGATGWHRLGQLMNQMGKLDKAEQVYQTLLDSVSASDETELAHLHLQLGLIKDKKGDFKEALSCCQKTLEIYQKSLRPDHPELATICNNIGLVYQNMGDYSNALSFFQKVLGIREQSLPPNHPDLAIIYINIGSLHANMGEYPNALSFYQKAHEIQQRSLPLNHPSLAISCNNIGLVNVHMGRHLTALSFYQKMLEIQQKSLLSDHPALAGTYMNIGGVHSEMGDYSNALSFYQKALEIRQKSFASDHPSLGNNYSNIGSIHEKMGDYSTALSFYQKTLEIYQKSLPLSHPALATVYNNIGLVYKNMGDYSNALSFYQKTLEIQQKSLSPNHPDLARAYINIGGMHNDMGDYSTALLFYQRSLEIQQKSLSSNHPLLAITYNSVGLAHYSMGDYSTALSFFQRALEIRKQSLPPNHPDLAATYNNIGAVHYQVGDYSSVLLFFQRALEIEKQSLPPDHPDLASTYNNIGGVHYKIGDYLSALSFYQKTLEIYQKSFPSNHPNLGIACNNIGTAYDNMGNHATALSFYERAVEIGQHSLPENHALLQTWQNNLAALQKIVAPVM
jgi:tetratricopeptide (TPR) repeat protein